MINTYNRQPISFGSNKDYDKQFLYGSFNGINDNKNVLSVDQESFADANNIYVSDDNLLVSRPPIKSIGITNVLKVWTFNNKILVLKNDFNLLAYNKLDEEPIATLQYDVPADEYKINCLQVENKIYVFTNLTIDNNSVFYALFVEENEFKDAIDYVYIPITKLVTNNVDEEYESANFLTSADKTRFLYSALSFVDFSRLMGKKVTVNLDNKEYIIDEWKQDNEKVLVSAYSNVSEDEHIDIKEVSGVKIILKYNKRTKTVSISYDGVIFKNLPYVDNIVPNTIPYLSEDGFNIFVFTTDCLKRCTIAALVDQVYEQKPMFVWEDIPYCERDTDYKNKTLNNESRAYGSFITGDLYAYIITCENPIRNDLQTAILYAQWTVGTTNKCSLNVLSLDTQNLQEPFLKLNIQNLVVNQKEIPNIITLIVDKRMARDLNLVNDYNTNGVAVLIIREINNNYYIFNEDVITIKNASFWSMTNPNSYVTVGGYIPRSGMEYLTDKNMFGFKIQKWYISNGVPNKMIGATRIKYGDYVSLVPLLYDYETEITGLKYYTTENETPCPPFRKVTSTNDLYIITGGTTGNDVIIGDTITLTDQHTYDGTIGGENINGKIYSETVGFEGGVVQLNYHAIDSEPDINTLKNNLSFHKILGEDNKPDCFITTTIDEKKATYNFNIVAALKYNNMVANVLNEFSITFDTENDTIYNYTIPSRANIKTKIPFYNREFDSYITDTEDVVSEYIENFAWRFKFNKSGLFILSDQYYYDIEKEEVINLVVYDVGDIHSERKQLPILFGDYIYYTYDNKLYTNETIKQITLDITNNEHSYTQKVFDKKAVLNEYFLSFGNLLEISRIRRNTNNETMLYLPKINEFTYTGDINELHLLSSSEVGVFLDSEIWTIKSLGLDNNRTYELWSNIRTKLNLGIKAGSEVITAIDGSSVIFATPRGIANMHYQENVQSADQILGYLSNNIQYTYDYYKDKSIKFVVHKYLILCYLENDKNILLFDIKRNAWWKWSYKANITKIFAYNDIVYILSNNSLYKFDTQFEDYTDDGDKIDWFITTQKLHFGNLNNTKFVKRLTIMALGDKKEICKVRTNMFRQLNHTVKEDYLDIEIDDLRTLVKKFSFMSVNQFQLMLSADLEDVNHYQLKINTIGITYQLKGGI